MLNLGTVQSMLSTGASSPSVYAQFLRLGARRLPVYLPHAVCAPVSSSLCLRLPQRRNAPVYLCSLVALHSPRPDPRSRPRRQQWPQDLRAGTPFGAAQEAARQQSRTRCTRGSPEGGHSKARSTNPMPLHWRITSTLKTSRRPCPG
jgi:hypothetical protein